MSFMNWVYNVVEIFMRLEFKNKKINNDMQTFLNDVMLKRVRF